MDSITYREVELSDAVQLIGFMKGVLGETPFLRYEPEEFSMNVKQEEDFISNFILNRSLKMILALHGKEIIAIGSIEGNHLKKFRHNGEYGIVVKKAWWNKGIARDITTMLLDWARDNAVLKKINLHVHSGNTIAIAFYRKVGFREEGRILRDFYYNKTYYDTLIMGLNVD
ncbi:GNAT family N-acetyltransferase [Saccharicrinis sp. FJH54]|uniref:GNAT family N-acetyltransferase n=1 Tax=Saccharicrinis sp. FJH54 TaxID=3344665 RepID=UPI0035D3E2AD